MSGEGQILEATESPVVNPLGLTDREVLIVWAWATGRNAAWLSGFTGRKVSAIRENEKSILRKLGVRGKTHATAIVFRKVLGLPAHAAAKAPRPRGVTLDRIIEGAHTAIEQGADPMLILSYIVWPPEALAERLAA